MSNLCLMKAAWEQLFFPTSVCFIHCLHPKVTQCCWPLLTQLPPFSFFLFLPPKGMLCCILMYFRPSAMRQLKNNLIDGCVCAGYANPRFLRSTMYNVPCTSDMLKASHIPFALALTPFARLGSQEVGVTLSFCSSLNLSTGCVCVCMGERERKMECVHMHA